MTGPAPEDADEVTVEKTGPADAGEGSSADEKAESAPKSRLHRVAAFLGEAGVAVLVTLVLTALLRVFVMQIFQVPSGSMEHTLEERDRIAAVRLAGFERGDVVVFEDPDGRWMGPQPEARNPVRRFMEGIYLLPDSSQGYLVKRVIGMPGDHVVCCKQTGAITVNGVALEESGYLYTNTAGQQVAPSDTPFDVVVPADHIFVMGDHRDRSGDSRLHLCEPTGDGRPAGMNGFVPMGNVVGPVKAIVLPLGRVRGFEIPDTFIRIPPGGTPPAQPVVGAGSCPGR